MEPLKSARPQRVAATKPKNYGPASRKITTQVHSKSPPNPNAKVASPTPLTPAAVQQESLDGQATTSDAESVELVPDDVTNMAAGSTSVDEENTQHAVPHEKEGNAMASTPTHILTPGYLDIYFKQATDRFHSMIQKAVDQCLEKLTTLESSVDASIQFERKRVDAIEENQKLMESKMKMMEKEVAELRSEVMKNKIAANKSERISRRNNVRIVGVPEPPQDQREDCVEAVEGLLRSKFEMETKLERAHRDGRKVEGRPRHILVRFLSYREKVDVMRRAREALKDERCFVVDDLTQSDLEEKRKWRDQVQEMYKKGTKLSFYAGKWRQHGGIPFNFK
ncbi:uncharacterized protein [Diadema antillarum]|uniref:uncharacterized protein n=1 Tax=Diadema antillarum TaxID=105358 RepID=UPI003A8BB647